VISTPRRALVGAVPWHPDDFLGSRILDLTGHGDALQRLDGGDGTLAIHGRGGPSLQDPRGTADSHGCIRLSDKKLDWSGQSAQTDCLSHPCRSAETAPRTSAVPRENDVGA